MSENGALQKNWPIPCADPGSNNLLRLNSYGDLRLSAANDTASYVSSSQVASSIITAPFQHRLLYQS
jgi:hypothetical protein